MSYASVGLALGDPTSCVGENVVYDPITLSCHCAPGMVRDPRSPGTTDCVDPSLPCPEEGETWDELQGKCVVGGSISIGPVTIFGSKGSSGPSGSRLGTPFVAAGTGGGVGWLLGGVLIGGAVLYAIDRRHPKAERIFG